jgi:hypothetical protein
MHETEYSVLMYVGCTNKGNNVAKPWNKFQYNVNNVVKFAFYISFHVN